ncbi:alpha/beta fold hydrolase [Salarchaeum sp. JOR-1]|uniref:alpha/beta fold hydrolase n=1 Tax=Salarchaeum sp. JOR-1 TaxID=2599399 RepID=UPI001198474B|nr:alpha/beta hydrolase [Salarchaeum sp. JOR-1]QDX39879.1 alpha/beta hydrolase [Salarchaeum sp. JOR-1]
MSRDGAPLYTHRAETVSTDRGTGDAVVFAHGTLMDRTMFAPQLDAFAGDYRTVAFDLRARTDRYADDYDLDDLVADTERFLDAKDIGSCVLAGMSMGGFMGLKFALEHPDRLDGLVLIDSMAKPHPPEDRERHRQTVDALEGLSTVPAEAARPVTHELFGETTREERTGLVDDWVARWTTYPGDAVTGEVYSWLGRDDLRERVSDIDVPVLAVHGEEDATLDIEDARESYRGIPDLTFEPIPEAGHSSNCEHPDAVNAALGDFLDRVY